MSSRILVTGAGGMLARAIADQWRDDELFLLNRAQLDVTDHDAVRAAIRDHRPQVVVQCAAFTRVDDAEQEEADALAVNAIASRALAEACHEHNALLVFPSTDYVFDGCNATPYAPDAVPNPVNAYGRSKLAGEQAVRSMERHLIVRTAWLYGPGGRNFVRTIFDRLRHDLPVSVVNDQMGAPTWTFDFARSVRQLIQRGATGTYHCTARGVASWFDVARAIASTLDREELVTACSSRDYATAAQRPSYSVLDSSATENATASVLPQWRASLLYALETDSF